MSLALAVARKGDRISHASSVDTHDGPALLGVAVGALVAAVGSGGVATAALGAGVAAGGGGKVKTSDVDPHTTSGQVTDGAPAVLIGPSSLPAALAGAQTVDCHHHRDKPIRMGSETVLVGTKRLARQTDQTACGAILCDGDKTVLVGGAPKDGAPPDPLALIAHGAAVASVALGVAIAAGEGALENAARWGEAIAKQGADALSDVEAEVMDDAKKAAGEIGAKVGALVGTVRGAMAGAGLGALLG